MKRAYVAAIAGGIAAVAAISAVAFTLMMGNAVSPSANQSSQASENTTSPEIFPIDSKPYGKSYGEWNGEVWAWFQGIPLEMNPGNDETGALCDVNQVDPNVWFMINTFGGKQERECTVPEGRALVVLIGGVSCSYAEDPTLKTEADLRKCAEDNVGSMTPRASINGVPIQNVKNLYSVSPVTPVTLPEGNIWDVQGPVDTEFVAAAWVLIIEPLPPGEHVLQYSAEERDFTATSEPVWSTEVVYHLTVTDNDTT